jgi:hypothetical protein
MKKPHYERRKRAKNWGWCEVLKTVIRQNRTFVGLDKNKKLDLAGA